MKDHFGFMTSSEKERFVNELAEKSRVFLGELDSTVDKYVPDEFVLGAHIYASFTPCKASILRTISVAKGWDPEDTATHVECLEFIQTLLVELMDKLKDQYGVKSQNFNPEDN